MNSNKASCSDRIACECLEYSAGFESELRHRFALLNVYRGDHKVTQLAPELRFYAASQQPSTMVAHALDAAMRTFT